MTPQHFPNIFDQLRQDTIERIERYGYTAMVVGTGECAVPGCTCRPDPHPYAYSLGFHVHEHPELVVFGLPVPAVNVVMNPVLDALRSGSPLDVGRQHRHQLEPGPLISLVPVPDLWVRRDPGRIAAWIDVYRPPLPSFVQICWGDHDGRMPWEIDCDPAVVAAQPVLAEDPLRYPKPPRPRQRQRRRG